VAALLTGVVGYTGGAPAAGRAPEAPVTRTVAAALVLLLAAPVLAQEPPATTPPDPAELFQEAFNLGLEVLTKRDLPRAEQAFKRCLQLDPRSAVSHYNLCCTYSLGERTDEALAELRAAFDLGFVDLGHVSRDTDLDPIRTKPAFRALVGELERQAIAPCPEALITRAASEPPGDKANVLVWVHDQRAAPERDLAALRAALPEWTIIVPQGVPTAQGVAWDGRCETVVLSRVRAALAGAPPRRVLIAGQGVGAPLALEIAANHPDLFLGVLAAGPGMGDAVAESELSGVRGYLVSSREDIEVEASAVKARDRFVRSSSPVVLERRPQLALLGDRDLLVRALGWLRGDKVALPGAGREVSF
jgi:hypothetical protein